MRKALVVGINAYPKSPLYGCINDATAVGDLLETHADGSRNFDVQLEVNVGSRSVLRTEIVKLFRGSFETVLLYFSGHGFINELGGYIVTPDSKRYDEGILMDEILKLANDSKSINKIIILDCCYAGAMGSPSILGNGASFINEGVTILTASKCDEPSTEINGHGIFTTLLIDALNGAAADLTGYVTPGSIYTHIDKALGPFDQRPVFKANTHKFISLRSAEPPISPKALRNITSYFTKIDAKKALDRTYEWTNAEAIDDHVKIFKELKKMQSVGLVAPIEGNDLYWAAQNCGSCELTALGKYYWSLVTKKRI